MLAATGSVDSQLRLPATISLSGPNKDYILVTTTKLRFNNPNETGAPSHGGGVVTFAGTIDIPYFTDLEVQAITTSTVNDDPADDSASFALTPGWTDGGETFFSHAEFDADHRCFPPAGISFDEYRAPTASTSETYLIKARQDLFGFIPLEYPLLWDDTTRRFASSTPREQDIFVAQMEHKIDWMDAKFTNISFGATYDGLPELKLTNFLNDQIDSAATAIADVVGAAPKQAIDAGLAELEKMLEDSLNQIIDPVIEQLLERRAPARSAYSTACSSKSTPATPATATCNSAPSRKHPQQPDRSDHPQHPELQHRAACLTPIPVAMSVASSPDQDRPRRHYPGHRRHHLRYR